MNKENCALKLVDEIILYYDARSKKHQITDQILMLFCTGEFCQELQSRLNFILYPVILATISREGIYAYLGAARANLAKSLPKQRIRRAKLVEKP